MLYKIYFDVSCEIRVAAQDGMLEYTILYGVFWYTVVRDSQNVKTWEII